MAQVQSLVRELRSCKLHGKKREERKKTERTILTSEKKIEFKTRDKEKHYIMINGLIQKEDSTGKYVCTLNRNT